MLDAFRILELREDGAVGLLVVDSDKGKLYIGGDDRRPGQDLGVPRSSSPRSTR